MTVEFASIFGDEALSRATLFRWFSEFNRAHTSVQDGLCEGCPKSGVVAEVIIKEARN